MSWRPSANRPVGPWALQNSIYWRKKLIDVSVQWAGRPSFDFRDARLPLTAGPDIVAGHAPYKLLQSSSDIRTGSLRLQPRAGVVALATNGLFISVNQKLPHLHFLGLPPYSLEGPAPRETPPSACISRPAVPAHGRRWAGRTWPNHDGCEYVPWVYAVLSCDQSTAEEQRVARPA